MTDDRNEPRLEDPAEGGDPWTPPDNSATPRRKRNPWVVAGIAVAAILALSGLLVLAALTVFVTSLNSWGSNK